MDSLSLLRHFWLYIPLYHFCYKQLLPIYFLLNISHQNIIFHSNNILSQFRLFLHLKILHQILQYFFSQKDYILFLFHLLFHLHILLRKLNCHFFHHFLFHFFFHFNNHLHILVYLFLLNSFTSPFFNVILFIPIRFLYVSKSIFNWLCMLYNGILFLIFFQN